MHSSTSSFKPLPRGWASLLIALAVAAGVLGGLELFWRSRGFVPTLEDAEPLWCTARKRASGDAIAIVGSSRLQTEIDPAVMSTALGGRTVTQLALAGANPLPVLLELADDAEFTGVVLFEYMPRRLLTGDRASIARMDTFLAWCHDPSIVAPIEARLGQTMQKHVVVTQTDLQLFSLLSYFSRHRGLPREMHQVLGEDRFRGTFPSASQPKVQLDVWEPALSADALAARLQTMRAAIAKIRARGGQVVIYRPIASGEVLADEESRFPAAVWFSRVVHELDGPAIDFSTVAALRDIHPQDGEHPQIADVPVITRAIAAQLGPLLQRH